MIEHFQKNSNKYYIAFLCMVVIILSTKGIMDERVVAINGDMPKYLMNGVFFYDLTRDLSFVHPLDYAYKFFAKYPALSLGHHPLLLGIAEVPFYSIFGISVFSGRMTIIVFILVAAITWFLLVRLIYSDTIAFFSSLLFITTPFIVDNSRIVMPEIPTLSLIIVTAYFFLLYCESDKNKYAYVSAVTLSLAIYSKQLAVFLLPVFLFYLIWKKGFLRLIEKELIISYIIIFVLILPLFLITLKFSQTNVAWVTEEKLSSRLSTDNLLFYIQALWDYHLTLPVLMLSLISFVWTVYRRDKKAVIFFLWIISCYLLLAALGIQKNPRYAIYWIPAYTFFAAVSIDLFRYRSGKFIISILLLVIAGYQFVYAFQDEPDYAYGYEQAARYVVENKKGESIMFSGVSDTGYFIFFVRKHDPERDLIILRADKILATSKMNRIVEERITKREEIYEILENFGIAYIVLEDAESDSRSLELLREEVKSERFILRKAMLIQSNNSSINNVPLAIYEYKGYKPPAAGAILNMNIPLIGESIVISFDDLLKKDE